MDKTSESDLTPRGRDSARGKEEITSSTQTQPSEGKKETLPMGTAVRDGLMFFVHRFLNYLKRTEISKQCSNDEEIEKYRDADVIVGVVAIKGKLFVSSPDQAMAEMMNQFGFRTSDFSINEWRVIKEYCTLIFNYVNKEIIEKGMKK